MKTLSPNPKSSGFLFLQNRFFGMLESIWTGSSVGRAQD
jgi:hypothetical protein